MRLLDRALRLVCAVAIALVATFHVCNATDGRVADIVSVATATSGDVDGTRPSGLAAVEKCHVCAVASLPALLTAEQAVTVVRTIPAGTTLQVTPFSQPTVGPPPRA